MRISETSSALSARQSLGQSTSGLKDIFARVGSGKRLQGSAAAPASTAISSRLSSAVRSLNQTGQDIEDGIGLTRTAGSQLEEVGSLLTRMRELAIQGSNGTLSDPDRSALQVEFDGIRNEVDRVSLEASSNGKSLFDGSSKEVLIPTGTGEEPIEIQLEGVSSEDLGIRSSDVSGPESAAASLDELDAALDSVSSYRGDLGATENQLSSSLRSVGDQKLRLVESDSRISDADLALEAASLAQQQILQKGTASILLQSNVAASRAQSLLGGYA